MIPCGVTDKVDFFKSSTCLLVYRTWLIYEKEVEHASRQKRHDISVSACQQEAGNVSHTACQVNASQVAEEKQNRKKKRVHNVYSSRMQHGMQCLVAIVNHGKRFCFRYSRTEKKLNPHCVHCVVDNESGVTHLWHCSKQGALVQVVVC